MQAPMLRVPLERTFYTVGSNRSRKSINSGLGIHSHPVEAPSSHECKYSRGKMRFDLLLVISRRQYSAKTTVQPVGRM